MRVIISAGGTGGHIYPALAIIDKIKSKEPKSEILYIGTTDRMEATIIPEKNIPYVAIEMKGLDRKNIFNNFKAISSFNKAIKETKKQIIKFKPDIVLGIGGYVTSPVIYTAKKMGIKTFIHEQNSIPGLSNRFLSHYADVIGVSLPQSLKYFPKKAIYTGNPRSEQVLSTKKVSKTKYGFNVNEKLIVIVMGSLGSTTMTNKIKELIPSFATENYEVLLITGKAYYENYKNLDIPSNVKLVPYLDDFLGVLKETDLIVSRAGASTIAEITTIGIPSILVPSPYVTANHQMKNAQELQKYGASCIIEEQNFSKDTLLPLINKILSNKELYQNMVKSTKKLAVLDSASKIYEILKELIGEKNEKSN